MIFTQRSLLGAIEEIIFPLPLVIVTVTYALSVFTFFVVLSDFLDRLAQITLIKVFREVRPHNAGIKLVVLTYLLTLPRMIVFP